MSISLQFTTTREDAHDTARAGFRHVDGNVFFHILREKYYVFTGMSTVERHHRTGKKAFTFNYEGLPPAFTSSVLRTIANDMQVRA